MAKDRLKLQEELRGFAPKAYYKRPSDNHMTYPCIVYRPSRPAILRADNRAYLYKPCYNVIYISREPNDEIGRQMTEHFEYCDYDREYESDNLYHYSFTLYW